MAMMRLFFFGTLMDPDVRELVLGRPLAPDQFASARLRHFRCVYVAGRLYPMIVPRAGAVVDGLVVEGLGEDDLARLNAFEGDDYGLERRNVELVSADSRADGETAGKVVPVWLYRCRRAVRPSVWEWQLKTWKVREKAIFLRETREWLASLEQIKRSAPGSTR